MLIHRCFLCKVFIVTLIKNEQSGPVSVDVSRQYGNNFVLLRFFCFILHILAQSTCQLEFVILSKEISDRLSGHGQD